MRTGRGGRNVRGVVKAGDAGGMADAQRRIPNAGDEAGRARGAVGRGLGQGNGEWRIEGKEWEAPHPALIVLPKLFISGEEALPSSPQPL